MAETVYLVYVNNGAEDAVLAEEWVAGIYREREAAEVRLDAFYKEAAEAGFPGFSWDAEEGIGYEDCDHWFQCRIEEHEVN